MLLCLLARLLLKHYDMQVTSDFCGEYKAKMMVGSSFPQCPEYLSRKPLLQLTFNIPTVLQVMLSFRTL